MLFNLIFVDMYVLQFWCAQTDVYVLQLVQPYINLKVYLCTPKIKET